MSVFDLHSARALIDEGKTEEARRQLESLAEKAPTHAAAFVLLARLADAERRTEDALDAWRSAYALVPTSECVRTGLKRAAFAAYAPDETHGKTESGSSEGLDMDHLIRELEDARIVPDPDIGAIAEEELENDIEDLVSETLARIYAAQKYYSEAQQTYEKLARQHPARRNEFETKALEMAKLNRENG